MKLMAFSHTAPSIRDGSKIVTRRLGWKNLKPGEVLMAVVKRQGIPKGGKVERIRPIRVINVRRETIDNIELYPFDVKLEGFPKLSAEDFIKMFMKNFRLKDRTTEVTRIQFEYVETLKEPE